MDSFLILLLATFIYGLSGLLYVLALIFRRTFFIFWGRIFSILGVLLVTTSILFRWIESYKMGIGHIPLSNLYESLIFFSWIVVSITIFLERKYKNLHLGAFIIPIAFLTISYALFSSGIDGAIRPLVPALRSNWLTTHVVTCFFGYAAFTISFVLSAIYVIKKKLPIGCSVILDYLPEIYVLEQVNYQIVIFGLLFLSIGIITGSVWANSAWGSYWSWDPKETWSLITWLIYAVLLHVRLMRNWSGEKIAYISIIGFIAVLFTYFGVNYLEGLHSYAKV